jgi:hypothetical protein
MARDPARPFSNVRVYVNSFDAIHTRTIRTFLHARDRRLPIWVQSWSQTEAGAIVIRPYLRRSVRRVGRRPPPTQVLGWPIPFLCKLRAIDPDTGAQNVSAETLCENAHKPFPRKRQKRLPATTARTVQTPLQMRDQRARVQHYRKRSVASRGGAAVAAY